MKRQQSYHGLLVIDKPPGVSSRDVVNHAQRWFPRKTRIGHAGTLDPLATGVLVLCVGVATRLTEYVQRMRKVYQTRIRFGASSDSDDIDGNVVETDNSRVISRSELDDAIANAVGDIEQIPPDYSAVKVSGKRAYELARAGETLKLKAKIVRVYRIDVLAFQYPVSKLEIECGKGTYIRSIARDLGDALGTGAIVETLRRTRIGPFDTSDALTLDDTRDVARERLLPLAKAVEQLPRVQFADEQLQRWTNGQSVPLQIEIRDIHDISDLEYAVFDGDGALAGIGVYDLKRAELRPGKVLQT